MKFNKILMKRKANKKAKEKSKNKLKKKKGKSILEIVEFMDELEREKKNQNYNDKANDIEENEYKDEILQINEDISNSGDIEESDTEKMSNESLENREISDKEISLKKKTKIDKKRNDIKNKIIYTNKIEKESNIDDNNLKDNLPNKYFMINSAKKINKKEILDNDNKELNEAFNLNYSITWLGKKYFRMTRKKDLNRLNYIYYYCSNHRTMKNSKELNSKGNIKRVSYCNSRIVYDKQMKEFYTDVEHSSLCKNQKIPEYENLGDINEEIENYKEMKLALYKYLNSHPMVTCKKFIKKGYDIYNKNKCKFDVKNYTFKNIYYTWRKNSLSFTKYSAIQNSKTLENDSFLRDYTYITLYNASGKSQFEHEHMIFISNYFVNKISASTPIYIDGTFLYPDGFKQLIVILYRDDISGIRYPGLFALINNRKYEGYKLLFERIKFILTIENSRKLNFISYSIDFEKPLINATSTVFDNIRQVGCYYHYCRNIREKAVELGLEIKGKNKGDSGFLNEFYKIPFIFYKNQKIIENLKIQYLKTNKKYEEFLNYFENQWYPYLANGMLNYHLLSKEQRSNSYIENYNRRIKLKLSKYLLGRNKCKISWPLFLYFIKTEEDDYRKDIYNKEKELKIKYKKIKKFKKIKKIKKSSEDKDDYSENENNHSEDSNRSQKNNKKNNIGFNILENKNNSIKWFKWNHNSCRYDCFSLIYALIICPVFKNLNVTPETYNVEYFNKIFDKATKLNDNELKKGFWDYLLKNKDDKIVLTTNLMGFKSKGTIYQILDLFRGNYIFCLKYLLEEGCTKPNCIKRSISNNYLNPYIVFKEDDILKNETIISKFKSLLINELTTCKRCGYDSNGDILDLNNPIFYRLVNEIHMPKLIIVIFDLFNESDKGTLNELEFIEYERRKQYNMSLYNILKEKFVYEDKTYVLKSLIFTPQSDHFTTIIMNNQNEFKNLKKNVNYYYNGDTSNHSLEVVEDIKTILDRNIIYSGIYVEEEYNSK